jgi:hypothetical protein
VHHRQVLGLNNEQLVINSAIIKQVGTPNPVVQRDKVSLKGFLSRVLKMQDRRHRKEIVNKRMKRMRMCGVTVS